jgi:uncharacterized membrane protein
VKFKIPPKTSSTVSYVGYILALVGGVIILLFGFLDLLGVAVHVFRYVSVLSFVGGTVRAMLQIAIGIVCIIGSRAVSNLTWLIVLIVLGIIAGTGGALVVIGAILGLVSIVLKSTPK